MSTTIPKTGRHLGPPVWVATVREPASPRSLTVTCYDLDALIAQLQKARDEGMVVRGTLSLYQP